MGTVILSLRCCQLTDIARVTKFCIALHCIVLYCIVSYYCRPTAYCIDCREFKYICFNFTSVLLAPVGVSCYRSLAVRLTSFLYCHQLLFLSKINAAAADDDWYDKDDDDNHNDDDFDAEDGWRWRLQHLWIIIIHIVAIIHCTIDLPTTLLFIDAPAVSVIKRQVDTLTSCVPERQQATMTSVSSASSSSSSSSSSDR